MLTVRYEIQWQWELLTMIESVVALLMFVNAEIKEARLQGTWPELPSGQASRGETV